MHACVYGPENGSKRDVVAALFGERSEDVHTSAHIGRRVWILIKRAVSASGFGGIKPVLASVAGEARGPVGTRPTAKSADCREWNMWRSLAMNESPAKMERP